MSNIQIETSPIALNLSNNTLKGCLKVECNNGIFVTNQPSFKATRQSSGQSIPNNTLTNIIFDTVVYNKNSCVSYDSLTGNITVLSAGLYAIYAQVGWAANVTGSRLIEINFADPAVGRQAISIVASGSIAPMFSSTSTNCYLNANDVLAVRVLQNSGGNLNVTASLQGNIVISRIC